MIDCDVMDINGTSYIVLDEIEEEGNKYVFLSNENNPKDVLIKRSYMKDNQEYIDDISDKEFTKLLGKFFIKHKDILNELNTDAQ